MVTFTRARQESDDNESVRHSPDDLSDRAHRQLIGYIGLLLPVILFVLGGLRRTENLEQWKRLDSISAYYYSGANTAFVGMLVALSLFLFTYRGYRNVYQWADKAAATTGAFAALGIAFFPTAAPDGVPLLAWWTPATGIIHHVSAIVLFMVFAVFSLLLFRLTDGGQQPESGKKTTRNSLYLVCGIVIVACVIWASVAGLSNRSIFIPESIALIAFAVSWLTKGYALTTISGTARSVVPTVASAVQRGAKVLRAPSELF